MDYPKAQEIMDRAYDLWGANQSWSYSEFVDNIDPFSRRVVLLCNLNYQVENGGFTQWMGNGYGDYASEVCRAINWALEGDPAFALTGIIGGVHSSYSRYRDTSRLNYHDEVEEPDYSDQDNRYYDELGSVLMAALEAKC